MGIIKSALIGRWVSVDLPVFAYNFLQDGVGYYSLSDGKKDFKYKDIGGAVIIHYLTDTFPSTFEYRIEGDLLVIKDSFGNDVKYERYTEDTVCISEVIEEDGGTKKYSAGEKTVGSDDISSFFCELSFISEISEEESELCGRVYKLSSQLDNGSVKCNIEWRDRFGEGDKKTFTADKYFLEKLQSVVCKYGFSSYNGLYCKTNGLPDMYGSKLDILYFSGERIYAYNNEESFIPFDEMKEIVFLFEKNM